MASVDLVRPTTSAMASSVADIGKDGRKSATRGLDADIDSEMAFFEPDMASTSHMSFVDGRCTCCPYGFHIDLDFLRYLDSLNKSTTGELDENDSLANVQKIQQNKAKLRKSMEVFLRRQSTDPNSQQQYSSDPHNSGQQLMSIVERENSLTTRYLEDFDSSLNQQLLSATNTVPRRGSSARDDERKYFSEARLTLSHPPRGQKPHTDYDSSSSVSISSGPPSPGLSGRRSTMGGTQSPSCGPLAARHTTQTTTVLLEHDRPLTATQTATSSVATADNKLTTTTTTTTTKSSKSLLRSLGSEGPADGEGGIDIPAGMKLVDERTIQSLREQMANCMNRIRELEGEKRNLESIRDENASALNLFQTQCSGLMEDKRRLELELLNRRRPANTRTIGVGDCTLDDSFTSDADKLLHRNSEFAADIQVVRKVHLDSMTPLIPVRKPSRTIGVGDGDVFAEPPAVVRVHEKELSTEEKTELHDKEIKTVFFGATSELPSIRPAVPPKPIMCSIGVGSGNVFETSRNDSESLQLHEKEVRTVYIDAGSKDSKVTRNVGVLCKAATRDVGVTFHQADEAPLTRNVAVGVGEIGVVPADDASAIGQTWLGGSYGYPAGGGGEEGGERSDTSVHITNTALQQLNMAAFQSKHLRISNEQLQQVLDAMLKKNLRSVAVQCRFASVDKGVSAVGNADGTRIGQVTVGCSDDRTDVDVIPQRQFRSIGVDNRPSVYHRACGVDVVYRVEAATNTQTQGVRLERAVNTDTVLKYPAATSTDMFVTATESVATETYCSDFSRDATSSTELSGADISAMIARQEQQHQQPPQQLLTAVPMRATSTKARSTEFRNSRDLLSLGSLNNTQSSCPSTSSLMSDDVSCKTQSLAANIDHSSSSSTTFSPVAHVATRTLSAPAVTLHYRQMLNQSEAADGGGGRLHGEQQRQECMTTTTTTSSCSSETDDNVTSIGSSADTLCSVVWRGGDEAHGKYPVTTDVIGDSIATKSMTTAQPETLIKVFETSSIVCRSTPECTAAAAAMNYQTSGSASDGLVIGSSRKDALDSSLKSIMKSSSSPLTQRRRKEISFVEQTQSGSNSTTVEVVSGSEDTGSCRSSGSFEEGTYDGRQGGIVYSCHDDQTLPDTQMFEQHFRDTYEMEAQMLTACQTLAQWLEDSAVVTTNEMNTSLTVIQNEWFSLSSNKLANPSQVEDYLNTIGQISPNLVEYIINMTDASGNTALHYAVSHGNFEIVLLLLDTELVKVDQPNRAGYTAIMLASLADIQTERQRHAVLQLFNTGNVNQRATQAGQTALMLAVSHGKLDLANMLLEAGADINLQDDDGSTALMCASEHGHIEIVNLLLTHPDCDVTLTDNDGSTAMSIAMEAGHRDIGVLLYAHSNCRPGSPSKTKRKSSLTHS